MSCAACCARSFLPIANNDRAQAAKILDQFLDVIHERSGLLIDRGAGMYGFAHLTFQEYLAARAVASKDDFIEYTLFGQACGVKWSCSKQATSAHKGGSVSASSSRHHQRRPPRPNLSHIIILSLPPSVSPM